MIPRLLTAIFLLMAGPVFSQRQPVVLSGFSGLDTRSSDFTGGIQWARKFHNLDGGSFLGSFTARKGFDSVSAVAGMDSVLWGGLHVLSWLDNKKQIAIVLDSTGVGYASVYLTTNDASVNIKNDSLTRIQQYWGAQTRPYFEQVNDRLFMSSADHGGIVYDYNTATTHEFPLRAPGAVSILPLTDAGILNGQYAYAVSYTKRSTFNTAEEAETDTLIGVVSEPVNVSNGKMFIYGFTPPVGDSTNKPDRPQLYIKMPAAADSGSVYSITIGGEIEATTADANDNRDSVMTHLVTLVNADPMGGWDMVAGKIDSNHMFVYPNWTNSDSSTTFTWSDTATLLTQYYDTTYQIDILRSDNPKELDLDDSLKLVNAIILSYLDTVISVTPHKFLSDFTFTDNASPLGTPQPIDLHEIKGRDSTGSYAYRFGAPTFISSDSIPIADTAKFGVYQGNFLTEFTLAGMSYFVTYFDTISFQESPPGARLDIRRVAEPKPDSGGENVYTIGLPKAPTNSGNLLLNLYRSPIVRLQQDSAFTYDSTIFEHRCVAYFEGGRKFTLCSDIGKTITKQGSVVVRDSLSIGEARLVATGLVPGSTYTDSLRHNLWARDNGLHPPYVSLSPPSLMKLMFSFQGRLFFARGSRLYYSYLELAEIGEDVGQFGTLRYISINEGDGDEITMAYPAGDVIRVFKNESSYTVRQVDIAIPFLGELEDGRNPFWVIAERTGFFGCIAPWSHLAGPEGHYYLSATGMLLENASSRLTQHFVQDTVSARLKNFDVLSRAIKYDTRAQRIPDEQKYLWTIGTAPNDTTYMWDAIARGWSTWDMKIGASIIFDSARADEIRAGQDLYFMQPGSSTLMKYGGETNNGVTVKWEYESFPLLAGPGWKTISEIGLWTTSEDDSSGVQIMLKDFTESTIDTIIVDSLGQRYNLIEAGVQGFASKFFYLNLRNDTLVSLSKNLANTVIEAIEVHHDPADALTTARKSK